LKFGDLSVDNLLLLRQIAEARLGFLMLRHAHRDVLDSVRLCVVDAKDLSFAVVGLRFLGLDGFGGRRGYATRVRTWISVS